VGKFAVICEQLRSELDNSGSAGCFKAAVRRFHRATGIGTDGLWAVVESYLRGDDPKIYLKRIIKAHGGDPHHWMKWISIISQEPGCPKH
jgi:uncharacterized OsmC-like protein